MSEIAKSIYGRMGVSSQKKDVHDALKQVGMEELFPGSFCKILPDISNDPDYVMIQHEDGAGSKVLQAYIHYKESGDPKWFRGIAWDCISMNLDDMMCCGATEKVVLTDTIDRNPETVPGEVITELIKGFDLACKELNRWGVPIVFGGGETADLGDQVKTLTVNAAAGVRFKKEDVITGREIAPGDAIIGISGTGKASYDQKENSGIGSNGLTMARHALMAKEYRTKYPETTDEKKLEKGLAYFGPYKWDDTEDDLGMTVGEAILSPTRTNAPILFEILKQHRQDITGLVHNTGGGQTKCLHLGKNIRYVKDSLFEPSPIFKLIQKVSNESWENMYPTFNCGNRLDIVCRKEIADDVMSISEKFHVKAKKIGFCEQGNGLAIKSEYGSFKYGD